MVGNGRASVKFFNLNPSGSSLKSVVNTVDDIDGLKSIAEPEHGQTAKVDSDASEIPPYYGSWIFHENILDGEVPNDGTTGSWKKASQTERITTTYLVNKYYESGSQINISELTLHDGTPFSVNANEYILVNLHRTRDGSVVERISDTVIQANFDIIRGTLLDIIV